MVNDNLAYLILVLCASLVAILVKYTREDMQKGLRVIRRCLPF